MPFWTASCSLQSLCKDLLVQLELNNMDDFNYWRYSTEQVDFHFAAVYNSVTLGRILWVQMERCITLQQKELKDFTIEKLENKTLPRRGNCIWKNLQH